MIIAVAVSGSNYWIFDDASICVADDVCLGSVISTNIVCIGGGSVIIINGITWAAIFKIFCVSFTDGRKE